MNTLTALDFTREEVRKRMKEHAAAIWQLRVRDVEAADPLIGLLMDACAFEFENTAQAIDATHTRILDRLASTLCPDVIDLPRPAHAIFHARPDDSTLDLPQTAQFFHREFGRTTDERTIDFFFSPVVQTRLINADVRYLLSERGLFALRGRDRVRLERGLRPIEPTDHQSIWLGIEVDPGVKSLAYVPIYVNWDHAADTVKAGYYRKIQDTSRARWFLNGHELPVHAGFRPVWPTDDPLARELDGLHQLEQTTLNEYNHCFVTIGNAADGNTIDYSLRSYPATYAFSDQQQQRYFGTNLLWLELRIGREFPVAAVDDIDIRLNCFPILNRRLNEMVQRLQQTLNVYALRSEDEFLFIRQVYDAEGNVPYKQSPLRDPDELADNSFMWRPHGVGRFDRRNAREIIHYVQQMLRDESKAFSALGSGVFSQIIDSLDRNVEDLSQKMLDNPDDSFRIGYPYIFVKPRQKDINLFIEFWSTHGRLANGIVAGTRLNQYEGRGRYFMHDEKEDLYLLTTTVGGGDKPGPADKERQLRRDLLTRSRLVTTEDIKAECRDYFPPRIGSEVEVDVQKGFAEGLIENAGYVRCLNVVVRLLSRVELDTADLTAEGERCRRHLETKSAMNLPYRVRLIPFVR
ncbi:type VI secretion system baseplate subunit TssF [uncultured Spirosoma sp.]|uniref:type VI secretion system baseplate subunit TssF n=1 Tax=uncultured Spirosoma sp. TaxID=278208 RepID=UPI002586FB36|nr:type VI secretion system baseplate subunit TssF [uncultured Spirosoma sp.]